MSATAELEQLVDFDMWYEVLLVTLGFLVPMFVKTFLEGRGIVTLPDEAYGLISIAGSLYLLDGREQNAAALGGGVYIGHKVVNGRIGVQNMLA